MMSEAAIIEVKLPFTGGLLRSESLFSQIFACYTDLQSLFLYTLYDPQRNGHNDDQFLLEEVIRSCFNVAQ